MTHDPNCIFCKIVAGQIPAQKVYEDEELLAFNDIRPHAPVHFLIIPKLHLASLEDVRSEHEALLGRMLGLAPRLAREQGAANGFRTVVNTGADGGQEVFHLHVHVMGGPRPWRIG
ncbi:histidine triad nucleotide-binding protein [Aquabacterium sp. A7-Y]|uniref:histidine triad nucleotide-binding protein n=1 Tax=Aquabacterium sp. A7-Y TaxID=1349605 RepID=UPI00223E2B62|nr:histidine triad nucleotide-binding protein [Aquabacterium sp. A7-Y]MCW7537198.1 histidine triad nucleotide-binding protein [Aquabacterium sp. A7-Y]